MQDEGDDIYKNLKRSYTTTDSIAKSLSKEKCIFGCRHERCKKTDSTSESIFDKMYRHPSNYDHPEYQDDNVFNNFDDDEKYEQITLEQILHLNEQPSQQVEEPIHTVQDNCARFKEDHDMETEIALSETNWYNAMRNGKPCEPQADKNDQTGPKKARQQIFSDDRSIFSETPTNIVYGYIVNEDKPKIQSCNCSKSKCLKMYCECFKNDMVCGPHCNCTDCKNTVENIESIKRLKEQFKPKIAKKTKPEDEPCNCRNSQCANNYCPCHKNGKTCGPKCQCFSCENPMNLRIRKDKFGNPITFQLSDFQNAYKPHYN